MGWLTILLIKKCVCGADEFEQLTKFGFLVRKCLGCGAEHQMVEMTPEELGEWYRKTYHRSVYTHTFEEDKKAAKARLRNYGGKIAGKVLDVGSGNGAFVTVCREAGVEGAYGQEISDYAGNGRIYTGELKGVHFPMEWFQAVTLHDVLEHVVDPVEFLKECRRVLDPQGWMIIELPDFKFEKHWKAIEHVWCLRPGQWHKLIGRCGLKVEYYTRPIEGKVTFYCRKVVEKRVSVLVPPGIGDSYWSIVKLPGMMREQLKVDEVDVYVSEGGDGRKRSLEWLRKIPWLKACGYRDNNVRTPVFQEAYMRNGRYWFQGVGGCDHFLAFNGVLRYGADLDKVRPEWGSEWYPPLFESLEERKAIREFRERFTSKYVVAYFVDHGMYKQWLKELRVNEVAEGLKLIREAGYHVVFMGAGWDKNGLPSQLARMIKGMDITGETTIDEMFALLKGSCGVVGWPAGNTFMGVMLRKQTLLMWNKYFRSEFWAHSCPRDSWNKWYWWDSTRVDFKESVKGFLERI